ncbi:MAG TPA: MASE3 domain-containing protein [Nitrospirota bacterium]|nr:MASE3 domain-containing protein [Nitrospirota bacterium]
MKKQPVVLANFFYPLSGAAVLVSLTIISLHSAVLMHTLVEMFSIIVACSIFMIAWNTRRHLSNNYILFIGISFLFVSVFDLLHTVAYQGQNTIPGIDDNLATQLWITARFMGSISLLIAPLLMDSRLRPRLVFGAYAAVTVVLLAMIFYWKVFPGCVSEGGRLTEFKIVSEYFIVSLFAAALVLLLWKQREFDKRVLRLLIGSILLRIGSELMLTSHIGAEDLPSKVGHFIKIAAFYLFYKALVESALVKPYDMLFRNLKKSEEALREERDRVQHYLDVAKTILVVIAADQRVSLINKKGCEILEYDEQEIIGKNWFDTFVPARMRADVKATFNKLMTREIEPAEHFENPVVSRSGEERLIAWHNAVLENDDGEIIATLSSGEDITERKRAEEKLIQKTAELERSNAELEQFASVVSHDLKEPLVSLGGFAEILREKYEDKLDAKAKTLISRIISGSIRMESLIKDLLAYAKVNSAVNPFRPVSCNTALAIALSNLGSAIRDSAAVITSDDLPSVAGEETQLIQLFQNLIGNAIKYRKDRPPQIHVSALSLGDTDINSRDTISHSILLAPHSRSGWLISVSDNGIGIDPAYSERIFEIFYRLHQGDQYPGTGIGLAVCRKIVERHGGRIWVESEPGRGATFFFTLP